MACGGMIFIKKIQILEEKKLILFYFIEFFKCFYCSINFKRQSEHIQGFALIRAVLFRLEIKTLRFNIGCKILTTFPEKKIYGFRLDFFHLHLANAVC